MKYCKEYLYNWNWSIKTCYDVKPDDASLVIKMMKEHGVPPLVIREIKHHLMTMGLDGGLTYTHYASRLTIIIIGEASSPAQFYNTLDHEKGHAVEHISEFLGLENNSEDKQYLAGEIAQALYPSAIKYLCKCN